MAFSVYDSLGSVPPPDPLNVPAAGTVVGDLSANWSKRGANIRLFRDIDGSYANACVSGGGIGAATWVGDPFYADHFAEMAHGPLAWWDIVGGPLVPVGGFPMGVAVRQDPASDTCYALYTLFQDYDGGGCVLHQYVYRVNAGFKTLLAEFMPPAWTYRDDWWFTQLRVSGTSPVILQVVNKAPLQYVVTGVPDPQYIPDFEANQYVVDGVTATHNGYLYSPDSVKFAAASFTSSPNEDGFADPAATGAISDPRQAWFVGTVEDYSTDRILSGQPGMRWDGQNTTQGWGGCHFRAGDISDRLRAQVGPVSGGSAILSGTRVPGSIITVT